MKVTAMWVGLLFVVLGVAGVLDATGVVSTGATIGRWWPVAIIGWALAQMVYHRRVSLVLMIVFGLGVGLLADQQNWSVGGVLWSVLFVALGVWLIFEAVRRSAPRSEPSDSMVPLPRPERPPPTERTATTATTGRPPLVERPS